MECVFGVIIQYFFIQETSGSHSDIATIGSYNYKDSEGKGQ